ncbi:response regulator [uncultured Arcticibacterium sp.]|uniref:response regulator n=1 Tax=uncultured Arcticibacterium sp. TaxID=2173042 RepID=UPI0030FCD19C
MTKLRTILLIDDDIAVNYIHKYVIKKADVVDQVITMMNGQMAIDYLINDDSAESTVPELIFLDINMPGMDGWGFLDGYKKQQEKDKTKIIMLTTSDNESDKERAMATGQVLEFITKPLTKQGLLDVIGRYF